MAHLRFLVLLGLAAAAPAWGGEAEDHEALRQLKAQYEDAVNHGQIDRLKPHLAGEFSGVMVTGEPVKGYEELAAYWKRIQDLMGAGGTYTVALDAETSALLGDVAVAQGSARDLVRTEAGKEYRFPSHWTAVLVRREGAWKLLRVQASMDPVGNPFVKAAVKEAAFWSGGGMLALGGLLGWLLGARRRKASP